MKRLFPLIVSLLLCSIGFAANEIEFVYPSGSTLYAVVRQPSTVKVWDAGTSVWDTWADGDVGDYDIPMTDNRGDYYTATFPGSISSGSYSVSVYVQAGASPAVSDEILGMGPMVWTGSVPRTIANASLASDGLDSVSIAQPTTVPATFREMLIAIYLRFFSQVTMTTTKLTVYDTSGTAITEQTLSDDGTTQTIGVATAP